MKTMPLELTDLDPQESTFTLSTQVGKTFTLCKFSLRVRAWAMQKYTPEGLRDIFEKQKIIEIAEIAFFMLKEKAEFNSLESFMDSIVTIQDQLNLIMALLSSIGIGEPQFKKINDSLPEIDDKKKVIKKKTGEKSSIP